MPQDSDRLFTPLLADLDRLRGDLHGLALAHWRLAQIELQAALTEARRLAIGGVAAGLLALVSLPVLVVALAEALDGRQGISRLGWLAIFGGVLLIGGVAAGWLAWRRFRSRFVGLEETLDELREDAHWLRQWVADRHSPSETPDE